MTDTKKGLVEKAIPISLEERLDNLSDMKYGFITGQLSTYIQEAKKKPIHEFLKTMAGLHDWLHTQCAHNSSPAFRYEEASPFNQPAVVMKPMTAAEFLDILREKIGNPDMMPTSKKPMFGVRIHSKPEYFEGPDLNSFLGRCISYSEFPTYAVWDNDLSFSGEQHAVVPVGEITLIAALTSLKCWVGAFVNGEAKFWQWEENQELPIDRIEFNKRIDLL